MVRAGAPTMDSDILPKKALEDTLSLQMFRGKKRPFVLCFMEVDDFAALAHRQGMDTGEVVLGTVQSELERRKSTGQVTFRYGPGEVGALVPGANVEQVFAMLDELRKAIYGVVGKGVIPFTVRAGLAGFPRDAENPQDLIRKAEDALHRAAKEGGNCVCLADSGNMILKSNYYTEGQLERLAALARREGRTEASLLREALDDVFKKYDR